MLELQLEQSGKRDPNVFIKDVTSPKTFGGFTWSLEEGYNFWERILVYGDFDVFYARYAKSPIKFEYHQEFKKMFRMNKIPNTLSKEILEVLKEKNVHEEWINK